MSLLRQLASDDPTDPVLRVVSVADPGAGADFTFTVPGASTWELLALTAQIVTDGTAQNRTPGLRVTDGTDTIMKLPIGVAITTGLTVQVSWVAGACFTNTTLVGNTLGVAMPRMILPPGFTFGPVTGLLHSGDQWSTCRATVIEVFTGQIETERAIQGNILERLIAIEDLLDPRVLTPYG